MAKWRWLDESRYPEYQISNYCAFSRQEKKPYCMAVFSDILNFRKRAVSVKLNVSGDTFFRLYVNNSYVGCGPAAAGGDWLCRKEMCLHFSNEYQVELPIPIDSLLIKAEVQLGPVVDTDYSKGRGGFYLDGKVIFEDGTSKRIGTDGKWNAYIDKAYTAPYCYDGSKGETEYAPAEEIEDIWHAVKCPIPLQTEKEVYPLDNMIVEVPVGQKITYRVPFDRIYSGYIDLTLTGALDIKVSCFEKEDPKGEPETIRSEGRLHYRSFQMHSIGGYIIEAQNRGDSAAKIGAALIFTSYPVKVEGSFKCSDKDLNAVYDVCKWTLRSCRQTLHLDSPMHQEPLACTGDYYIESLMTAFTFGDMRLAELDLIRTAKWLEANNGRLFHTSYSMLWIQMLYDVYMFTGNKKLLSECEKALILMLKCFEGYVGENGLLENAPDYMFVDWVVTEGMSMHHPPKALGEMPLCAYYYGGLKTAEKLLKLMQNDAEAVNCVNKAEALKIACNTLLYDSEKGLYFDGTTTPTSIAQYLPQNIDVKHFSRYGNTLAVLYGLVEGSEAIRIMTEVMENDEFQDIQPYFMHFVLEALTKTGLFDVYGMKALRRWKVITDDCTKGLKEGWFAPQEDYSFDYSHAWGGTPAYQLPCKLLGFEMLKPGFKKIRLNPKLYDLESCEIKMPTPYGFIECRLEQGKAPVINVPKEIQLAK